MYRLSLTRSVLAASAVASALLLASCAPTLQPYDRVPSAALSSPRETSLGRAVAEEIGRNPGKSGFHLLASGPAALGARVALADAAERTLDIEDRGAPVDEAGPLLAERLLRAADRGVRVRILLDDLPFGPRGLSLASLAAHPNIHLRLFNPLPRRTNFFSRLWNGPPDDPRFNRRLHSRAFIADNAVGAVGGRFGGWQRADGDPGAAIEDLELFVAGPAVQRISASFDEFWESDLSVPVQSVLDSSPTEADLRELRESLRDHRVSLQWVEFTLGGGDVIRRLLNGRLALQWATARVLADHPGVGATGASGAWGGTHLAPLFDATRSELLILSPYFVPGREGVDRLVNLAARGVATKVLTWSLSATDVPAAQSVYARYRLPLLQKKISLYELRWPLQSQGAAGAAPGNPPLHRRTEGDPALGSFHSRAIVFDRRTLFVGSVSLDPRLATYATELGVVVESPDLAGQVAALFDQATRPEQSFRVEVAPDPEDRSKNVLYWFGNEGGQEVRYDREPETTLWNRVSGRVLPLFAPEGL